MKIVLSHPLPYRSHIAMSCRQKFGIFFSLVISSFLSLSSQLAAALGSKLEYFQSVEKKDPRNFNILRFYIGLEYEHL